MTHDEIERREIAEQYVRGHLSEVDRTAFEDHYFGCDACFAEVQVQERFVAAARTTDRESVPAPVMPIWKQPAFLGAMAACLVMAVASGWALLIERTRLTREIASARRVSEEASARLQIAERELAVRRAAAGTPAPSLAGSLPLLMLEASRAEGIPAIQVPSGSQSLALWVEPPPAPGTARYRLEILRGNEPVETIGGLQRNSYGALAVSVPAEKLTAGGYRARLLLEQAHPSLVGDYRFEVRR